MIAFCSRIESTNRRRFVAPDGVTVLAIYDLRPTGVHLYAPIGADEKGEPCFADAPRQYWPDEIEEIRD